MKSLVEFMKKNYKILIVVVLAAVGLWSFVDNKKKSDNDDAVLIEMLLFVLQNAHYKPADLNDSFSEKVYTEYLKNLDPNKRFFLQSEIDQWAVYKHDLDNQLIKRETTFFDVSHTLLQKKLDETQKIYREILAKPFDFSKDETLETDSDKLSFAKTHAELKNRWQKQLKASVLASIEDKQKIEKGEKEDKKAKNKNEKLVEKKSDQPKSYEELEKEARESTLKNLDDYFDIVKEFSRKEWFAVYLNTVLEQFDPHTNYLAPDDKKKFEESMSGSMEGIGAQLRKKNDYIEITEVIAGGPAWRQGELENGDIIIKVAQGDEEPVDIAGKRLDNVIKLIKGKKGTVVKLTTKKVDGSIKVITIVRDKFEIEETYAKSTIIKTANGKYGMIYLPKFYVDFETRNNKNAFTDVKKELEKLKAQGIEGVIIDLRNNGGGSLQTVVDMVGLFIEQGPIVQVAKPNGAKEVLRDRDRSVLWDGPLVVMINSHSASASEIFAAAIQDYNRGIVVGSKSSFGKGTVQNLYNLNDLVRFNNKDFGSIKFTTQKFYRINGGSTQLKGVESDIVFPDRFLYIKSGEKDMDNALPWDKIEKTSYTPFTYNFAPILESSRNRIKGNVNFKLMEENAKWLNERKDETVISLNYDKFMKKSKELEDKNKEFNQLKDYKNSLKFSSLPDEVEKFANDTVLKSKRDKWHENLVSDIYMEETVQVLEDLKQLMK
ncbi:carboxy terminal-processing peptidase [Capnocytophaga sp. ARDL2]|uniref:carboxy terminal-processing peptidase n=1 Tax=Capnocytophaga sp. ARDL2 TaxID=3238809 RepID=UPI003558F358